MDTQEAIQPLFHVLKSQQFTRPLLDELYDITNKVRRLAKTKEGLDFLRTILSDKRGMLYFVQPSTRTFLSFLNACQILGIQTCEIRDTNTSSEVKGESIYDTIRTFCSYVDVVIMRYPKAGFVEEIAQVMDQTPRPVPFINGGSGPDQHPTQALLDIYTLRQSFKDLGGLENKTIMMVGDLKRGRTVRSLTYLMKHFKGVKLIFVAPKYLQMGDDIKTFCQDVNIPFLESEDMNGLLPEADAVYMTRIQDEYDLNGESKALDYSNFHITVDSLKLLKQTSIIMHPFPRRTEINIEVDKDHRAMYWRQERNGMWTRVAILAKIFNVHNKILNM
ncbi:aspartate carbamoyltransferase [candidate division KSB1 bacterium]|nr:aspartate carbamoyltransferase [candidate division KSB1 bacterium]